MLLSVMALVSLHGNAALLKIDVTNAIKSDIRPRITKY